MTATVIRAPHIVQPINALTGALWAVSRGLRVFRVAPNAKAPYPGGSGINEATADRATIESWFAQEPSLNYGIPMGGPEKLVALDCDKKASNFHGDYLNLEYPSTLEFVSGTGGAHIIFKAPFDASQADLKGATSINVRSEGGYIVGPGSIVNDNRYQIYADAPIVPCPPEIAARLTRRGEKAANATTPIGDMDTPAAISRAWAIVAQHHGVDEGGRDNECFRVACKIKDEGVEAETCLTILHGFNAEKVNPPLPGGDLERIVASAYANGQRPPGAANPDNEFEPLGELTSKPKADPFGQSAAQWIGVDPQPSKFTIDKIVPEGFVTLLAAAGGRGKSLISLQAMICVAAGVPFLGYDVAQGGAAAIFCEDEPDELHRRTKAICTQLGVEFEQVAANLWPASHVGRDAILWTEKDGGTKERLEAIRSAVAARPGLKLLVLDGVSFLFAAPEYDRGQVTRFIVALTKIAQAYCVGILLIHHESKPVRATTYARRQARRHG